MSGDLDVRDLDVQNLDVWDLDVCLSMAVPGSVMVFLGFFHIREGVKNTGSFYDFVLYCGWVGVKSPKRKKIQCLHGIFDHFKLIFCQSRMKCGVRS